MLEQGHSLTEPLPGQERLVCGCSGWSVATYDFPFFWLSSRLLDAAWVFKIKRFVVNFFFFLNKFSSVKFNQEH